MAKFNFKIEKYNMFKKIEEFEYWISSDNRLNAWAEITRAYPEKLGYQVELLNID